MGPLCSERMFSRSLVDKGQRYTTVKPLIWGLGKVPQSAKSGYCRTKSVGWLIAFSGSWGQPQPFDCATEWWVSIRVVLKVDLGVKNGILKPSIASVIFYGPYCWNPKDLFI